MFLETLTFKSTVSLSSVNMQIAFKFFLLNSDITFFYIKMSQALCRKNVNVKKYFDEWDTWKNMINLNWSLLVEGEIFLTWVMETGSQRKSWVCSGAAIKGKINYLKGQTFFSFAVISKSAGT